MVMIIPLGMEISFTARPQYSIDFFYQNIFFVFQLMLVVMLWDE